MRHPLFLVVIFLACGLAFAQDTWVLPGQYTEPSPRVSTPIASADALPTPSLTLDTPSLAVGASNGTVENATGSPVYFNQPEVYDPGAPTNPQAQEAVAGFGPQSPPAEPQGFDFGCSKISE